MLRGVQTPGELKGRTERLHRFESLVEVLETLDGLIARELVVRHPRRPGQKEDRYEQLLGGDAAHVREAEIAETAPAEDLEARLSHLEEEVASLREALEALGAAPLPAAGAGPVPTPAPANPAEDGGEEPPRQTWASGEL
jgi:uncharacterized protein YceH (UPF0502 family)